MTTIADVAAKAGVGIGTVSRVLNKSPAVSDRTRERVLAVMEELDYRPSPLARGLPRGRLHTIGAIVPFFTSPSVVERVRGIVAGLAGSGYDLVLFDVETPAQRDDHLRSLMRRDRAAGLVVCSLPLTDLVVERCRAARLPVVLVDSRHPRLPSVVTDDVEGGRMAARHLLGLGHRRIAWVGDRPRSTDGFPSSAYRYEGFRDALLAADVRLPEHFVVEGDHDRATARQLATELLDQAEHQRPTAVFTASDTQALGVLEAAKDLGLQVPRDLSVLGFDDIEVAADVGLSTVRQPLLESGRRAAELVLAALSDGARPAGLIHRLPLELVARATTAPPPAVRAARKSTA